MSKYMSCNHGPATLTESHERTKVDIAYKNEQAEVAKYAVNGYQTIYTTDLYDVLFGNISTLQHSFLDEPEDESDDDYSDTDNATSTKHYTDNSFELDSSRRAGQHDVLDYYTISKNVEDITRTRFWGSWNDENDYHRTPEEYKKHRLLNIMKQFMMHSRFFISRALRQREEIRTDKRFRLGYLFFRLRRLNSQQLKLLEAATLVSTGKEKNLNLILRIYEKVIHLEVDFKDTIVYIKDTYNTEASYDTEKAPTTTTEKADIICFALFLQCLIADDSKSDEETKEIREILSYRPAYKKIESRRLDFRGSLRRYLAVKIAMKQPKRNMVCSPLAALLPLGKLTLGAKKRAKSELEAAIGLDRSEEIYYEFRRMIKNLENIPYVTLDVSSRIYVSDRGSVKKRFLRRSKRIFKSAIERLSMSRPSHAARAINKWVSEETSGRITKLLNAEDITPGTSMIIVNAIYFHGYWENAFSDIKMGKFMTPKGERQVPMMSNNQLLVNYAQDDSLNVQIVELPYEGGKASFIIVLPYERKSLRTLLDQLHSSPKRLNQALESMKRCEVDLTMPKFKIESEINLMSFYKKIGLRNIFRDSSDLTGILGGIPAKVSSAVQKAVIEVTEEGTTAAAATPLLVPAAPQYLHKRIKADRPFMFLIKAYEEVLFQGIFTGM